MWLRWIFLFFGLSILSCQSQFTSKYCPRMGKESHNNNRQSHKPFAISSTYLNHLATTEVELHKEILKYGQALEERLEIIQAYLLDYKKSSIRAKSDIGESTDPWERATKLAGHPIMAYRMIRRFVTEFNAIGNHLWQGLEYHLQDYVTELSLKYPFPSKKDLGVAMDALLCLHYVYDLEIEKFARGTIMGIQTEVGLRPSHTFKLAEYAAKNEYYTLAMDWLKVTETMMMREDKDSLSLNVFSMENLYKQIIEKHDIDFDKNKENSHLYMFNERLSKNPNAKTLRSINYEKFKGFPEAEHALAGHYNELALCNGDDFQSPQYKATLKCWYSKRHPYFILFPLKAELLHHEPMLIQFHEVISDRWWREMKKAAMPTLQPAPPPAPSSVSYAYLEDEQIPLAPITRRIELITGLNVKGMNASTVLQIGSYVYGGHVSTHHDWIGKDPDESPIIKWQGERITTFLVYLNDVPKGGLTAFPALATHVKPEKNSAVLWYNVLKNGDKEMRMHHGACLMVLGNKWIATKWTYVNQNFLKRPCDLDPNV